MTDAPWTGDACSLVDAYRAGAHRPIDELEAVLAAAATSPLNTFSFLDPDAARAAAARADVTQPFGGVPLGIKELDHVAGWPATEASLPLKDRVAEHDSVMVGRLKSSGAIPIGLTTSSEFGGVNITRTVLNGVTRNPWNLAHTPGGSSGGSAAAVSGGLLTLATAGDGGGSIRIPAGFCGLVGLKVTFGRIPRGSYAGNLTAVPGNVARSVRDAARWLDVCDGFHPIDPRSLPRVGGWEEGLGTHADSLRARTVAIVPDFGGAYVTPETWAVINDAAEWLIGHAGLRQVEVDATLPSMGTAWSLSGLVDIYADLGSAWPDCADDLTPEIRGGLRWAQDRYNLDALMKMAQRRAALNEAMAALFDRTSLIITASNPDVAFAAEGPLPSVFGGKEVGGWNNGRLTAPSNLYGNPAISIPVGTVGGLPVGMQVIAPHFQESVLLDLARAVERERPWPLVAPIAAT